MLGPRFALAVLTVLSLGSISGATPTPTTGELRPRMAKRQQCEYKFCAPTSQIHAGVTSGLKVPALVRADVLIGGQVVRVSICEYATLLGANAPLASSKTCIYESTGGLITTTARANINLSVLGNNNEIDCPTTLACSGTAVPQVSQAAVGDLPQVCAVTSCPSAPVLTSLETAAVIASATVGVTANVAITVCSYVTLNLANVVTARKLCYYARQHSDSTSALSGVSQVVGTTLSAVGSLLFDCPSSPNPTCAAVTRILVQRSLRGTEDYVKAQAAQAIASRQWTPGKRAPSSNSDKSLKRRKW